MYLVSIEKLESGMVLAEDIFVSEDSASPYVCAGTEVSKRLIGGLRRRGVFQVQVEGEAAGEPLPELAFSPPPGQAEQGVDLGAAKPKPPHTAPTGKPEPRGPRQALKFAPSAEGPAPEKPASFAGGAQPATPPSSPASKPENAADSPGAFVVHAQPAAQLRSPSLVHAGPTIAPGLRDDALGQLEELFAAVTVDRRTGGGGLHRPALSKLDGVVGRLVGGLMAEPDTLVNISNLRSFDDYTYHHSVAVAVLAVGMGQYMGLSAPQLRRLGLCAIMHDIGKTAIPLELLHKPARLSNAEYELIKTHSAEGYRRLLYNTIGDEELWRGVLHHHERVDGNGYPRGLRGADIPLWSRIISAADVYDALTSQRSYRRPIAPGEAVEYLMGGIGSSFDYDVIQALIKKVDLYPLGSRVELSDGRVAEVVDGEHPLRPVVRVLGGGEILDLYSDRRLLSVVIRRLLAEENPPARAG